MQFALSLFEPQIFEKSLILGEYSEKNPAFLYHKKTGIIPCYHFSSSFPHGKDLSECRSALLRCKGRTHRSLLHKRTSRCAAQKPSSPAFHPFLSAPDRRLSEASRSLRNFSVESPTDYSLRHCFFRYFKFFRSVKKVSTGAGECQAPTQTALCRQPSGQFPGHLPALFLLSHSYLFTKYSSYHTRKV